LGSIFSILYTTAIIRIDKSSNILWAFPGGRAVTGFATLGAALLSALANATLHIPNALRHSKNLTINLALYCKFIFYTKKYTSLQQKKVVVIR
jgi:hypothetical protein